MPISFNGELVLDERAGLQGAPDDDSAWTTFVGAIQLDNPTLYAHLFTAAGDGLNWPTGAPTGTFPQVASQGDFVQLSAAVGDLMLVGPGGAAFPATGLASGLFDTDHNEIRLYADDGGNVVLGRTGGPTGPIVFAIVLDEHGSGSVTGADMYLVQFAPLDHPTVGSVDGADTVNLDSLVYLAAATSSTTTFSDFSGVPSGQDNWTIIQPTGGGASDPDILVTGLLASDKVNVSTTGLGTNSQAVDKNEGLRFDFVNGGRTGLTSSIVHDDSQIGYTGGHQEGTGAGFTLTQVNPGSSSTTVSTLIKAYDAAGDPQGGDFKAQLGSQTQVNIASLRVYDAGGHLVTPGVGSGVTISLAGDDALVSGLKAGYRIDFSTDDPMDRFTVQNVTSQGNRTFDVGAITLSQTNVSNDVQEVGSLLKIEDDGPSISQSLLGGTLDFAQGQTITENLATSGADGSLVTITSFTDDPTLTETLFTDATGQHLVYSNSDGPLYRLDVTAGAYTFSVLQDAPAAFTPLDFSGIPPGSPHETLTVPTIPASALEVTFDGVLFSGTGAVGGATSALFGNVSNPGAGSTNDDLNANTLGFGEKLGQASQMNQNEGFFAGGGDNALDGLEFDIQGIGGVKSVNVEYWLVDDGAVTYHHVDAVSLPSGSASYDEVISGHGSFDQIYVRFYYDGKVDTSGVRVLDFKSSSPVNIPTHVLDFTLTNTDGDGDTVTSNSFQITVDPNWI
jgi:hypothetical protein